MKSVLLNTTVIGSSVKLPRHPRLIIGEPKEYVYGDILDANAVVEKLDELIGGAPEALDTLKELAEALHNDPDLAGTIMQHLAALEEEINNSTNNQNNALTEAIDQIHEELEKKADLEDGVIPYNQLPTSIWAWGE